MNFFLYRYLNYSTRIRLSVVFLSLSVMGLYYGFDISSERYFGVVCTGCTSSLQPNISSFSFNKPSANIAQLPLLTSTTTTSHKHQQFCCDVNQRYQLARLVNSILFCHGQRSDRFEFRFFFRFQLCQWIFNGYKLYLVHQAN